MIFANAKASLTQTLEQIKRFLLIVGTTTHIIYIGYLIYALAADLGVLWVNAVLLGISVIYLIFYIYSHMGKAVSRGARRGAKRAYKRTKLLLRAYTLGVAIYGVYTAAASPTFFSVLITSLMLLSWIVGVILEALVSIIERRIKHLIKGIEADIESLKKPTISLKNSIEKLFRKNSSEEENEKKDEDYVS